MNLSLADIESVCPEEDVVNAEILLENQVVGTLRELDRNLWGATIANHETPGPNTYEVELSATRHKVTAASCECTRFQETGSCSHLVAVMLLLRRHFQEKAAKREAAAPKPKPADKDADGKLTIAGILDQISHEDLIGFVKHYARYNRNFAIALKTRFAVDVQSGNSHEKYAQLLEAAIADARRPDRTFTRRGAQKVAKVMGELQLQVEGLIAQKWFAEVFPVLQNMIEKVTPILRKAEDPADILHYIDKAFRLLQQLVEAPIPPALRDQIWEYSYTESQKLVYRNTGMDKKFLSLMLSMANDEARMTALMAYLDKQIDKYFWEKRDLPTLIITKLELLEKAGRDAELALLLQESISHPDVLRFAISRAIQDHKYSHAQKLALYGLQMPDTPDLYVEMEMVLWFIAEEQNDTAELIHYARSLFLQTLEWRFAASIQKHAGANWPEHREALIAKLETAPRSPAKNEAVARLLANDDLFERLMAFIEQCRSVELLIQHDQQLIPRYNAKILALYKEWLHKYLHDHVGRKPSKIIRQLIEHLMAIQEVTMAAALVEEFTQAYPERHTLMEELQSLQTV